MILKIVFVLTILCAYSHGQRDQKFFRKDYTYLRQPKAFYKIHTLHKVWADAKRTCELEGASLFYPEDDEEAHTVISFWNKTQTQFTWMYVGISDFVAKGVFETIDGRSILDIYHVWDHGEPNDGGNGGVEEHCVEIRQYGAYNDNPCTLKGPFICKKSILSLEWNGPCNMPNMDYVYNKEEGRCYKFHLQPLDWMEAYAACSAEQSYLAVINSQLEADYLVKLTANAPLDRVIGNFTRGSVLLGFHNKNGDGWLSGKGASKLEDNGYAVWAKGQPNGGDREQCGSMSYSGELNDIACDRKSFFICEHEITLPSPEDGKRHKKMFHKDYTYLKHQKAFYKFHTLHKVWADAKRTCELEGASLFYPEDDEEAYTVMTFWNQTQPQFTWIYVGISDFIAKGVFETVDGRSVSDIYNVWDMGEPNDGGYGIEEHCVELRQYGAYNDNTCNRKGPFICKKSIESLEWNGACQIPNKNYVFSEKVGRCYNFHQTPMDWSEAHAVCSAEQSYLAVINSQLEAHHLVKLIENAPKGQVWAKNFVRGSVLLGFHNKYDDGWRPVRGASNLEDSGYVVWGRGQPDGGDRERCGAMSYNGELMDIACDQKSFFICEHEVESLSSQFDLRSDDWE